MRIECYVSWHNAECDIITQPAEGWWPVVLVSCNAPRLESLYRIQCNGWDCRLTQHWEWVAHLKAVLSWLEPVWQDEFDEVFAMWKVGGSLISQFIIHYKVKKSRISSAWAVTGNILESLNRDCLKRFSLVEHSWWKLDYRIYFET